jgi:hypothetical protein
MVEREGVRQGHLVSGMFAQNSIECPLMSQLHRALNTICIVLTIAGAACIFAAQGWAVDGPHQYLGCICLVLAWFNSFMREQSPHARSL